MGYLYCMMGKSASGKDTIYQRLISSEQLHLRKIIPYTTRPVREGEIPGQSYFFCTEEEVQRMQQENQIIELRAYHTMHGVWKYFTADDGQICLREGSYLLIGTLDTYAKLKQYFGEASVIPVYIEVEDGERLNRALQRERLQKTPKYEELCRRFLADQTDFSEENVARAGIGRRFQNTDPDLAVKEISDYIMEKENICRDFPKL